jgi:hypothetical protein
MKLFKVTISKSKLNQMPQNERIFFVLFGALLNDLSMFQKLMIFSANPRPKNQVLRTAQNIQTLNLARFQIGILSEGYQLLQKNYFGTKVSKEYEPLLSKPAKQSLENLKRYFSTNENWMCSVRNRFCFHYPSSEEIEKLVDDAPDSEILEIFMSEYFGNCLFSMSNIIVNFGILKCTGGSDIQSSMNKFLRDAKKVSRWFGDFLGECLLVIANKHLGFEHTEVEMPEPNDIDVVTLPYFVKGE